MLTKVYRLIFNLLVISLFLCSGSFAQNHQTDIGIHPDLVYQPTISAQALTQAQTYFDWIKTQLTDIKNSPSLNLSALEKERLDKIIDLVQARKDRLKYVDVYFISEVSPGEKFQTLYDYYNNPSLGLKLENLVDKASQKAGEQRGTDLIGAINLIPAFILSDTPAGGSKKVLTDLIANNKLKAVAGGAGKSRISILTVFVTPNQQNPTIEEKTTVVIATDN